MTALSITAVVLTLNEAEHLAGCLASLKPLTPRVFVLDSGSTDGTAALALAAGAELRERAFDGFASQRNAALAMAGESEWIVFIDADERLTTAGAAEIQDAIVNAEPDLAACWLPRRNLFFGRELRGGGWWPDYQARVLRHSRARYDPAREVHETVLIDGKSRRLREPLLHINYTSRREFIAKQRAYTERRIAEAGNGVPRRRAYLGAPARELWRRIVLLRGYRDGLTGLFLATVLAIEEARACWLLRRRAGSW